MRDMQTIRAELGAALEAYNAAVNTQPPDATRPLSEKVKALQTELTASIAAGANPCSRCQ